MAAAYGLWSINAGSHFNGYRRVRRDLSPLRFWASTIGLFGFAFFLLTLFFTSL
jgi:hypothetical protein